MGEVPPYTFNRKLSTLHPMPYTRNSKLLILNPNNQTPNPEGETRNPGLELQPSPLRCAPLSNLADTMCLWISLRNSTPPQNRQLDIFIGISLQ